MNKPLLLALTALTALLAWQFAASLLTSTDWTSLSREAPHTVAHVDLERYMGTWYEEGAIPVIYEKNCQDARTVYTAQKDGFIGVQWICFKNGEKMEADAKAIPDPKYKDGSNSKLKIEMKVIGKLNVDGQHWVVRLDDDYTYTVVSTPNYKNMWIYSRDGAMTEPRYQAIVEDLKNDGFPVEKLVRTSR